MLVFPVDYRPVCSPALTLRGTGLAQTHRKLVNKLHAKAAPVPRTKPTTYGVLTSAVRALITTQYTTSAPADAPWYLSSLSHAGHGWLKTHRSAIKNLPRISTSAAI